MSLLDAWITPAEAIVAVDTDGVDQNRERKGMSKLLALPHLNAVIAMRGSGNFLASAFHLCMSRGLDSFDDLLSEVSGILRFAEATLASGLRVAGFPDMELVVVGYSDKEGRMLGRLFTKRGDEQDFTAKDTEGCIAPYDAATMADIPRTADALAAIARAQVRYMQATAGLGGGKLIVARLERDHLFLHRTAAFQSEQETAHADFRPAA